MRRIANSTRKIDANGAGKDGFSSGSLATQEPATIVDPTWLNDVQEEICNVIELVGIALGGDSRIQLATAISVIVNTRAETAETNSATASEKFVNKRLRQFAAKNSVKRSPAGGYAGTFHGACSVPSTSVWPRTIIVGTGGEIEISSGGEVWTKISAAGGYTGTFRACCHVPAAGDWVYVVGDSSAIQSAQSLSSMTFAAEAPAVGFSGSFRGVAANAANVRVAVGTGGEIQSNSTGTWVRRSAASGYTGTFNAVRWVPFASGGLFIAVGDAGEVQTSPDGVTWTRRTLPSFLSTLPSAINLACVDYGTEGAGATRRVYAVGSGGIFRSFDGVVWTAETDGPTWGVRGIAYCEALSSFVGAGTGLEARVALFSPDVYEWATVTSIGAPSMWINAVCANEDGVAIMVGANGLIRQTMGV